MFFILIVKMCNYLSLHFDDCLKLDMPEIEENYLLIYKTKENTNDANLEFISFVKIDQGMSMVFLTYQ